MRLEARVFRAHNPRWSFAPLSGEGAARHGGRFNPAGLPALYASTRFETAWLEAQQGFAFKPQPLTLCAYDAACEDAADLTEAAARDRWGFQPEALACAWEDLASRGREPPSWALARRLFADGVAAIVVPSFAPGAGPDDRNVVFWRWGPDPPHQVRLVDDEARLPKDGRSWAPPSVTPSAGAPRSGRRGPGRPRRGGSPR